MNDDTMTSGSVPFKNIDLEVLRCVAIILVVINHSALAMPLQHFFLGYTGVDVFFAVSGYIITISLLNSIKKKQSIPTILKSFWTKRVFRILPMAYLWTIIPIILAFTFNSSGAFGSPLGLIHDGIANITQTANFHWEACNSDPNLRRVCGFTANGGTPLSPFWSLSTEEQFYLVFPLLLLLITRNRLVLILSAIPIILIFFDRRNDLFVLRFDSIAVGVLLALAQTQQWYKEYYPRFLEKRGLGVILLLFLVLLIGIVPALSVVPFSQSIVVLLAMILVFIASFNANLFTRPIPWLRPFFIWLGDRSYAIYLIHIPAFLIAGELYARIGGSGVHMQSRLALISAVLIFVLVEISCAIVERPLRRYGRKLAKNIESKNAKQLEHSSKLAPEV